MVILGSPSPSNSTLSNDNNKAKDGSDSSQGSGKLETKDILGIVFGIVGAVAGVIAASLGLLQYRRRRRRHGDAGLW